MCDVCECVKEYVCGRVHVDGWYVCELKRKCTPCASDHRKIENESARTRGCKKVSERESDRVRESE